MPLEDSGTWEHRPRPWIHSIYPHISLVAAFGFAGTLEAAVVLQALGLHWAGGQLGGHTGLQFGGHTGVLVQHLVLVVFWTSPSPNARSRATASAFTTVLVWVATVLLADWADKSSGLSNTTKKREKQSKHDLQQFIMIKLGSLKSSETMSSNLGPTKCKSG